MLAESKNKVKPVSESYFLKNEKRALLDRINDRKRSNRFNIESVWAKN